MNIEKLVKILDSLLDANSADIAHDILVENADFLETVIHELKGEKSLNAP
jgi:hypothetical protein